MTKYLTAPLTNIQIHKYLSDRLPSNVFLGFISAYIVIYGYEIFRLGLVDTSARALALMVLPIMLTDVFKTIIECLASCRPFKAREDLSKVTVIIPTYNGERVLANTLTDLVKRFSQQNIIVSSNGSTDRTIAIANQFGVRVLDIPRPVGKVEAINQALQLVHTPYVLTIDDDVLIGRAVMPTNLLDKGYEGVAFRVLPVVNNWITRLQAYEYRKSMDIGRAFHNPSSSVQSISGAIGLFHTQELIRQTAIHTGEFSGEDLQRTLIIHLNRNKKGVVITNSVVRTVVPETISELFKQRIYGWGPGLLSNLGNYWKILFSRNIPFRLRYEAFFTIFVILALDPLRLFSLPVLLFSPGFFAIFYFTYICVEFIPYIKLGAVDPLWVVFVSPFYGLFTFVARAIAIAAFIYRRTTCLLGRSQKLDDYKFISYPLRVAGSTLTTVSLGAVMWGYSYIMPYFSGSTPVFNRNYSYTNVEFLSPQSEISFASNPTPTLSPVQPIPSQLSYISQPGDSLWTIYTKLVDDYLSLTDTNLTPLQRNQLVHRLVQQNSTALVNPNQIFSLSPYYMQDCLATLSNQDNRC